MTPTESEVSRRVFELWNHQKRSHYLRLPNLRFPRVVELRGNHQRRSHYLRLPNRKFRESLN
ncbi:hypothetical protein AP9108_31960 [Arthrospira sp. PCC 9108]|nr:hypothetical protein AP9108_31960 [Arthrospira sp. PCC 9108]